MILLVVWLLSACTSQEEVATIEVTRPSPTATPNPTLTLTPTEAATFLPTQIPKATATPTLAAKPTTTSFPTVTPPPAVSTKTVFLQQGYVGGDGGSDTDLYYGREMPSLVIYTDGQVIFEEGNSRESYFLETTISPDEMCNLLSELQDFGFYDRYDPIYAFDETTRYSDGGPDGIVQVNGQLSKSLIFYASYRDYLVPPLKQAVEFIGSYRPSTNAYYIPERLVLWVEVATEPLPENVVAESWPDTLPNITELWQDPINGELLIEGELVAPIMALFDYRMTGKAFSDEGVVYGMILRPLLPNESPYPQLWYYHDYAPQSFNLPLACPDLDLPTIDPTPIPAPLPTREPVAELTSKGRILFDSNRDGNSDIYVMNADGTNLLNLTNHLAKDEMATWSPDGQKIAFVSDRDGNQELYLMNADGTNVTRLTHSPADEIAPEWSPDGKQIIFMSDRLTASIYDISNWQLFVVDVETGVDYQFTEMSFAEGMYSPAWSPDGEKVLFSSRVGNTSQIFMMDKNGENKKWLIAGAGAVWSPDGKQIAFLEIRDRGDYQIFVMKADGTDARQITRFARYTNSLDWSPDGEYLLYSSIRADGGQGAIYAVSTAGEAQPIQLTFYSVDSNSPDWSP